MTRLLSRFTDRPLLSGRRLGAFLGAALLVVVADQATKAIVRTTLLPGETWPEGWELIRIAHVQNSGAAFGVLQGGASYLAAVSVIAMAAIVVFLVTLPSHTRWYPLALSGILGGAVGNFIDRVRFGHVTDFIDPTHYPAFNVADSAIVLGVALVAFLTLFGHEDPSHVPDADDEVGTATERTERDEVHT
jgi:signal peptidase II